MIGTFHFWTALFLDQSMMLVWMFVWMFVWMLVWMLVIVEAQDAVVEYDETIGLQINTSDPLTQPVLVNGIDVVQMTMMQQEKLEDLGHVLRAQRSLIEKQHAENRALSAEVSLLKQSVCKLDRPASATLPSSGTSLRWRGGVLGPNGLIFGIPSDATAVLIIDPVSNTLDTTSISGLPGSLWKWCNGVLSTETGSIYGFPVF